MLEDETGSLPFTIFKKFFEANFTTTASNISDLLSDIPNKNLIFANCRGIFANCRGIRHKTEYIDVVKEAQKNSDDARRDYLAENSKGFGVSKRKKKKKNKKSYKKKRTYKK